MTVDVIQTPPPVVDVITNPVPTPTVEVDNNYQLAVTIGPGSNGFTHTQSTPASVWNVVHGLPWEPNVTVVVGGEEVEADVLRNLGPTTVSIVFSTPQTGFAYLS